MPKTLRREIRAWVGGFQYVDDIVKELFYNALRVRQNAQAPYSNYLVGASLQTTNGNIYSGCNVERATWTQTTHAEQNAIDSMVAHIGKAKVERIAIVGAPSGVDPAPDQWLLRPEDFSGADQTLVRIPVPCGHCLQCIWENCHGDPNVELFALMANAMVARVTIGDAFPMRFGPVDLGVDYAAAAEK